MLARPVTGLDLRLGLILHVPDSRPSVKRKVLPRRPQLLPALRLELLGVRTVDVFPAMHDVDLVVDLLALLN